MGYLSKIGCSCKETDDEGKLKEEIFLTAVYWHKIHILDSPLIYSIQFSVLIKLCIFASSPFWNIFKTSQRSYRPLICQPCATLNLLCLQIGLHSAFHMSGVTATIVISIYRLNIHIHTYTQTRERDGGSFWMPQNSY